MDSIKKFKYKKIENFLTVDETNLFKDYCRIRHRLNTESFDVKLANLDTRFYADPLMESLLINKK